MAGPTPTTDVHLPTHVLRCAAAGARSERLDLAIAHSFADWGTATAGHPVLIWASVAKMAARAGVELEHDTSDPAAVKLAAGRVRAHKRRLAKFIARGVMRPLSSFTGSELAALRVAVWPKGKDAKRPVLADGSPRVELIPAVCQCKGGRTIGRSNCACRVLAPIGLAGEVLLTDAERASWADAAANPARWRDQSAPDAHPVVTKTTPPVVTKTTPPVVTKTTPPVVTKTTRPVKDPSRDRTEPDMSAAAAAVGDSTPPSKPRAAKPARGRARAAGAGPMAPEQLAPRKRAPEQDLELEQDLEPAANSFALVSPSSTPPDPCAALLELHLALLNSARAEHGKRARPLPGAGTQRRKLLDKRVRAAIKDYGAPKLTEILQARSRVEWSRGRDLDRELAQVWADRSLAHWEARAPDLEHDLGDSADADPLVRVVRDAGADWQRQLMSPNFRASLIEAGANVPFGPVGLANILAAWDRTADRDGTPTRGELFFGRSHAWLKKHRGARKVEPAQRPAPRDFRAPALV